MNYFHLIILWVGSLFSYREEAINRCFSLDRVEDIIYALVSSLIMINRGLAILKSSFIHRWFKMQVTIFNVM